MGFQREKLPPAVDYFEGEGLHLHGRSSWRTTACRLHGGSDSLRVNVAVGAWVCMACGAKGGDILAYHMQAHGLDFVDAARALGAWVEGCKSDRAERPAPFSARAALQVLAFEAQLIAVAGANVARGVALTDADRARVLLAAGRINALVRSYE